MGSSSSETVKTDAPVNPARPKRLPILIKTLAPLLRLPLLRGLGRTTWLIFSLAALAVFLGGSFWARRTAIEAPPPARTSWYWWASSLEFHRELQLASFENAEIESVAVVRLPTG